MHAPLNPAARDAGPAAVSSTPIPYQNPFPPHARPEILWPDISRCAESEWVPQSEGVAFRPLCFSASQGYFVNLLRVRKSGVLSRHYHASPVHAYVLKGRWYYLEHDWVAEEGSYVMEPPGETHTLIVPDDVPEMITLFHVTGAYVYVDPLGKPEGVEDVFTKIAHSQKYYEKVGLGRDYVDRFIR
jgi:quercetin dioxygenase-like cupin family protein